MVRHFDHITLVVRDVEAAKRFFTLLGFEHDRSVVISGEVFSTYMGVPGIEAEHVTLVLAGARHAPRSSCSCIGLRPLCRTPPSRTCARSASTTCASRSMTWRGNWIACE